MNRRPALLFLFILAGCSGPNETVPYLGSLKRGVKLTVYEGLPHQMFEADLLEKERKTKPIVKFTVTPKATQTETKKTENYAFYKTPLKLKDEDLESIRDLLSSANTYSAWAGAKACGGFHPDFAVEWTSDGKTMRALICFGCGEIILAGGGQDLLYDNTNSKELEKILKQYQRNRPKE